MLSLSAVISLPVQASGNTNSVCAGDKSAAACQAYIAGLVEGYVVSKQNYLPKPLTFESRYLERAFANRVGKSHNTLNNKEAACLPNVIDKEKIIEHLMDSTSTGELTEQLGDYLRANYNCNDNSSRN